MTRVAFKPGFRFDPKREATPEPINFEELFGNTNPIEVEIGCGKGKFLIARAAKNSGVNFLGIDIAGKWLRKGEKIKERENVLNVQFMKVEVRYFLQRIADKSVSTFHINFPDPWPKKRHHKRRLIQADFLRILDQKLVPEGLIEIATDDKKYSVQIEEVIEETKGDWALVKRSDSRICFPEAKTCYEERWTHEGRELYYYEIKTKG